MRLDAPRLGLAAGFVWAAGVVFLAIWAGAIIGAIWELIDGFIGGFPIAWVQGRLLPPE